MLNRFTRSRALTVGVSCLVHAGLIVALLLAERFIISAHASRPPVLPIELVTLADAPPPEPVREQAPPPKPIPRKILRLPKLIEPPPPPQTIETATETPPPVPASPPTHAVSAPSPSVPAASDPAPIPSARASGPAGGPLALATDGPPAPTGLPTGKTAGLPTGNGTPGPSTAVASIPGPKDSASNGAITRYARPQGGYQVRPSYPSSARRLGIQGTTMLKVQVLIDGRVGDVLVEQSAGHPDLDQAATAAVRQWRFDPARRGEDPVAMWVLLPVEFRLR
jgi:protein TonB